MEQQQTYDVCHLTLLNAALHSRIFYKEAVSAQQAGLRVCVIGQDAAPLPYVKQGVTVIPLASGMPRWSLHRQMLRLALQVQAKVYHIHTPELLPLALLLKAMRRAKVVYDVHEDYAKNLTYGRAYSQPLLTRKLAALAVRALEKTSRLWVDYFLYAESCYKNILGAASGKYAILPNYYASPTGDMDSERADPLPTHMPILGYIGTIANDWGILETLKLWRALNHKGGSGVFLLIAGVGFEAALLQNVQHTLQEANLPGRWRMLGGSEHVPYETIIACMESCACISALYTPTLAIRERIPTKFYEAMAMQKPVLFTANPTWDALNECLKFGMALDVADLETAANWVHAELQDGFKNCYTAPIASEAYSWETVAPVLTACYYQLLKPKAA